MAIPGLPPGLGRPPSLCTGRSQVRLRLTLNPRCRSKAIANPVNHAFHFRGRVRSAPNNRQGRDGHLDCFTSEIQVECMFLTTQPSTPSS